MNLEEVQAGKGKVERALLHPVASPDSGVWKIMSGLNQELIDDIWSDVFVGIPQIGKPFLDTGGSFIESWRSAEAVVLSAEVQCLDAAGLIREYELPAWNWRLPFRRLLQRILANRAGHYPAR